MLRRDQLILSCQLLNYERFHYSPGSNFHVAILSHRCIFELTRQRLFFLAKFTRISKTSMPSTCTRRVSCDHSHASISHLSQQRNRYQNAIVYICVKIMKEKLTSFSKEQNKRLIKDPSIRPSIHPSIRSSCQNLMFLYYRNHLNLFLDFYHRKSVMYESKKVI